MKRLLSLALLCLLAPPALANSSTAGFSNEGLKLLKSSQPIKTLVAFPFPQMNLMMESDVSEVSGFTLTIGGVRQETRRETLYTVRGKKVRDRAQLDALLDAEQARRDGDEGATRGFTATEQHLDQDLQVVYFQ